MASNFVNPLPTWLSVIDASFWGKISFEFYKYNQGKEGYKYKKGSVAAIFE